MRTLKSEFPDYPESALPAVDGFTFEPWHNDACPRFSWRAENGDCVLTLFVDYPTPTDREDPYTPRFVFTVEDWNGATADAYFCAETEEELRAVLFAHFCAIAGYAAAESAARFAFGGFLRAVGEYTHEHATNE